MDISELAILGIGGVGMLCVLMAMAFFAQKQAPGPIDPAESPELDA